MHRFPKPVFAVSAGLLATPLVVAVGSAGIVLAWMVALVVLAVWTALWIEPFVHPRDLAPILAHRRVDDPRPAAADHRQDGSDSLAA